MVQLSLLIPYRQRPTHLQTQVAWWRQQHARGMFQHYEVILIEVDAEVSPATRAAIADLPIRYLHFPCPGVFHKTKALNLGLAIAQGEWIAPLDVDLIPLGSTLQRHLDIARQAPHLLVTGYRLMSPHPTVELAALPTAIEQSAIAPEDQPTALWKHLTQDEKFGVMPFFHRHRLQAIGGWDETFIGWGAEDQELIERYLAAGMALCRCPELVYLHLFHDREAQWSEPILTQQNRHYYYRKTRS